MIRIAGEYVGAGAWMYHCHVQSHSDMGMAGLLLVAKADGTVPGYDPHAMHDMKADTPMNDKAMTDKT